MLSEIIDYAGLFPPSEVSMAVAVKNFAGYLKDENGWLLGRFIVPANRLPEFSNEAAKFFSKKYIWRLSVLAEGNLSKILNDVEAFNSANEGKAIIDTLEIKVSVAHEITEAARLLPREINAFFEIPPTDFLTDFITVLAVTKQRAKIRTGGVTAEAFPSTDAIIKFMRICVAANIPFKATAGLHHPLRASKPLTYEPDSPTGTMHGFFNLFLSACFLRKNLNTASVHRLMNETDRANFQFSDEAIDWNGNLTATAEIELTREKNAISFGSCSFTEPVEDLKSFGLL